LLSGVSTISGEDQGIKIRIQADNDDSAGCDTLEDLLGGQLDLFIRLWDRAVTEALPERAQDFALQRRQSI